MLVDLQSTVCLQHQSANELNTGIGVNRLQNESIPTISTQLFRCIVALQNCQIQAKTQVHCQRALAQFKVSYGFLQVNLN